MYIFAISVNGLVGQWGFSFILVQRRFSPDLGPGQSVACDWVWAVSGPLAGGQNSSTVQKKKGKEKMGEKGRKKKSY